MSDTVRLQIAGQDFTGWIGVTIKIAVDQAADSFSVTAPFDPTLQQVLDAFRPFGYQIVRLFLGDDLIITGRIDSVSAGVSGRDRTITVQGRALTGILVDCSIDGPLEYSGLRLADIALKICRPLYADFPSLLPDACVRWDNNTDPIDPARARYGQRGYDFLISLAAPHNLLLHSAPTGDLVITWATWFPDRSPVAALVEGEGNLLSVSASFDGEARYSIYKIATQFAGAEDIKGEATDTAVPIFRPLLQAESEVDSNPSFTATRKRTEAIARSFGVSATLSGWRDPNGDLWAKREIGRRIVPPTVTLRAPGAMLPTEAKYTAVGITLRIDESDGKVADLRLVQSELYGGSVPEVTPWAS